MTTARDPDDICKLFAAFEARVVSRRLVSFGGLYESAARYCVVRPRDTGQVVAVVRRAVEHGVPIRTRGQGHAANPSAMPSGHELLLLTDRLCDARFISEGTVDAGAGIGLWLLRAHLQRFGFTLPVVNDGYAGPSVGGFVAAGGFGAGSRLHGGFWDNVDRLTVVDCRGELLSIDRRDPLFRWMFGAMGQLAIVVEARLEIVPEVQGRPASYPRGREIRAQTGTPESAGAPTVPGPPEDEIGKRMFWFSIFVPGQKLPRADTGFAELEAKYRGVFDFRPRYAYPIVHRRFVPPLIYPREESFFAVGSWLFAGDAQARATDELRALDADVSTLAGELNARRYMQTELTFGPDAYRGHFGDVVYRELRDIKNRHDPAGILNRGSLFPSPAAAETS